MSKEITRNTAEAASEKQESNNGKPIGGGVAAIIGALLMGGYAIVPTAIVLGLLGAARGAVFD